MMMNVEEYLKGLREAKKEKPEQIREALQIYIELWEKVIERGVIKMSDDIETALMKIDEKGGLYKAAES